MLKAVFIDFYGTLVYEDGEVIKKITQKIYDTGKASATSEIGTHWWNAFQTSFLAAYGDAFETQRELEYQSLLKTIQHFSSTVNARELSNLMFDYWVKPPIFEETKEFLDKCPLPVYIVSNIDRADIMDAIAFHDLKPAGVFTSEDARSYKPRKELFELALESTGLVPGEVVHIGDSLSSDILGASALGIPAVWINRNNRKAPAGVKMVSNLLEVFEAVDLD